MYYKTHKPHSSSGFTLIELLMVVAIIVILVTGGVVSFSSYSRKQAVRQAAETLKSNIRVAQNKALSEIGNPAALDSARLNYSVIVFNKNTSNYKIYRTVDAASCPNINTTNADLDTILGSNLYFANGTGGEIYPDCIFFKYGDGSASIPGNNNTSSSFKVMVQHPSFDSCIVTINKVGTIGDVACTQ